MRLLSKNHFLLLLFLFYYLDTEGQRVYAPQSVLSTGRWYKISVTEGGVYKMDMGFLKSLGLPASITTSQLRVFGRSGAMLPESNGAPYIDDLQELAIETVDGGDGVLDNNDHVLFYARGPHHWLPDTANKSYVHIKNLYSEKSFYYLTIGGSGKRITTAATTGGASVSTTTFDGRYYHELDSINFLYSGKEWYGEELADAPGRNRSISFTLPFNDINPTQPVTMVTSAAARSAGNGSRLQVQLNGLVVQQLNIPAVSTGVNDVFAQQALLSTTISINGTGATFSFTHTPGSFNAQAWLNWFRFFCRRPITLPLNGQLSFSDWRTAGNSAVQFFVSGADATTQVWDVTNPLAPVKMTGNLNGSTYNFTNSGQSLKEYMGFSKSFAQPKAEGSVPNQNLHAATPVNYIIITHPLFAAQAQRLAQFHQKQNGLTTTVVSTEQVFNEFAAGQPDPTALRDFVKMYYDRYKGTDAPVYLLLFGKGSFDPKNRLQNNTAFVPCYQSSQSLDPLSTYTSDDFFGFLDDNENINSTVLVNVLDIAIGRAPVKNGDEAKAFVDKIEAYHAPQAFGPWRNNLTFIADDEDNNLHLQDAEIVTAAAKATAPVFNLHKIYLDAYRQEQTGAGGRYPQATNTVNNTIFDGTLIWNYTGHGSPYRLAEEVVLDAAIVNSWNNENKLPLFITATCDFAPYDNPVINSLGENLLVRPKTGAVALLTTTRTVFAFSNRIINNNYIKHALGRDSAGRYPSLGKALVAAKNETYLSFGDITNNRKFALLGDPALTLAFPLLQVVPTTINGRDITTAADTLGATETVVLTGEVRTSAGNIATDFNGTVFLSFFDKPKTLTTLANDRTSFPVAFQDGNALLFKGKASAQSGLFQFRFTLPKDINYQMGKGKISLYAHNNKLDGSGFSDSVFIGGNSNSINTDKEGPQVKGYLNDESFVNGSITNPLPVLVIKLADSSGINISSAGIDQNITATLDGDKHNFYVLNNFYETDVDDATKGTVRFQLPAIAPGPHTLSIKAWDVLNNSSDYQLDFIVVNDEALQLDHVLNYPNPFTTKTTFWFEHNQPGVPLFTKVEIFTVSGKLIKTLSKTINTPGNRSSEVEWDGRDEQGSKVGRGVYLYRLVVSTAGGKKKEKWEKLVLLN